MKLLSLLANENFALPMFAPLEHAKHVYRVRFSPDGRQIVTASDDGTAVIWNAQTGEPVAPPLKYPYRVNNYYPFF